MFKMPRRAEFILIVVILVMGYSLYGAAIAAVPADGGARSETTTPDRTSFESQLQFQNATREAGFDYTYESNYYSQLEMMSNAGVYVTDYDGDGWSDTLALGGERPVLFHNKGGEFERSGQLADLNHSVHAAQFVDYDVDGDDDLLLLSVGRPPLFLENREGHFSRRDVGLDINLTVPTGAAAADYDADGCPDLFITQNGDWRGQHPNGLRDHVVSQGADNGNPNFLFDGNCSNFENATNESEITGTRWSLARSFVDLTGDGRPDIHVANDFNHDVLWVNQGNGTFERRQLADRTNRNGMSSEVADFDGDSRPDVFVTNIYFPPLVQKQVNDTTQGIRGEGNNLLVSRGNGTFTERAEVYSVRKGGWGWAAAAADFDNDGDRDLVHATRRLTFKSQSRSLTDQQATFIHSTYSSYRYPAVWERTGGKFQKASPSDVGFDPSDGRGLATLDFDNDGDLDVVLATRDRFRLYENTAQNQSSLQVDLHPTGAEMNGSGTVLGTRVVVRGEGQILAVYDSESDYLSQDTRILHFGTGNRTAVDVIVDWPGPARDIFEDVHVNQRIVLTHAGIENRTALNESAS